MDNEEIGNNTTTLDLEVFRTIKRKPLSPREVLAEIHKNTSMTEARMVDVLRSLSVFCKEGIMREADESGVFEYCGGLPK